VAVTVAPGIAAPLGSCTVPLTAPLPDSCAPALKLTIKNIAAHSALSATENSLCPIPWLRFMNLLKVFQLTSVFENWRAAFNTVASRFESRSTLSTSNCIPVKSPFAVVIQQSTPKVRHLLLSTDFIEVVLGKSGQK
jgi:hypothetical protein